MLTADNLKALATKLHAEEADLTEQLTHIGENLDFGDENDHEEEEADESEERANRSGIKESLEKQLERVARALEKMKTGTYGICEQCKGEISFALLSVDPESSLCKNCKAAAAR
jgi:RNA polymerase-binding transcription factor DksA